MLWVGHPKHVHFWRNIIYKLEADGHKTLLLASKKDITLNLLDSFNLPYLTVGTNQRNLAMKLLGMVINDYKALKISKEFKPDIFLSGISLSHVSKIMNKPCLFFTDTENAQFAHLMAFPFSDYILTPTCFNSKISSKKHVAYNSYEELSYLHPKYFKPDPSIVSSLRLNKNRKTILVRFVSWGASHDLNDKGFSNRVDLIMSLDKYGQILISSESQLPIELEKYRLNIPPEKIHHLMYYVDLFIGESASMAAECAILGTPSILVSTSKRGFTDELETKYGLLYTFSDILSSQELALKKASEILSNDYCKSEWLKKRNRLLEDKVDVVEFVVKFIENFRES